MGCALATARSPRPATRRSTTTGVPVGRGAAEVRAVDEPYGRIAGERETVVRSKTNDRDTAIDAHPPRTC
ncbi:hypothetical protein [Streptomyces marianii]|uniref:Uncharacterized protein n=1 Tax=Streptomyces marianii TaxID=1817406 RepID=A0A5R9E9X4_9ACTN|nr:hypothetical protein [Streptomyces marianii]TLQ46921.1 hypothetical protein FEF34_31655 [Streptomyces marianii]